MLYILQSRVTAPQPDDDPSAPLKVEVERVLVILMSADFNASWRIVKLPNGEQLTVDKNNLYDYP